MRAAIEDCVKKFLRMIKGRLCKTNDQYMFLLDRSSATQRVLIVFFLNLCLIVVSNLIAASSKLHSNLQISICKMFILSNFDIEFMT